MSESVYYRCYDVVVDDDLPFLPVQESQNIGSDAACITTAESLIEKSQPSKSTVGELDRVDCCAVETDIGSVGADDTDDVGLEGSEPD